MSSDRLIPLSASALSTALRGRNVLVIGGTAGIGRALSVALLSRDSNVTVVGRRSPDVLLKPARYVHSDLSLMKNAAALIDQVDPKKTDTIVFTNGIFAAPVRQETSEGIELDMAVSYLSRYVFCKKLIDSGFGSQRVNMSIKPRIFVMGYPGVKHDAKLDDFNTEEKPYSAVPAHMNAVVGNEALVDHLNTVFKNNANVYGLNPGLIQTEIRQNFLGRGSFQSRIVEALIGLFYKSASQYAEQTLVHALASPDLESRSGALIDVKGKFISPNPFLTKDNVARLIQESDKLAEKAFQSYEQF